LPVICVETRHMRAVLKAQINKTDRNDARGIAQKARNASDHEISGCVSHSRIGIRLPSVTHLRAID
jgi:hypothetical protein